MKKLFHSMTAVLLTFAMLATSVGAVSITYDSAEGDYYNLISKKDWDLAPGIVESEIVLNNDAGDRRQVMHVVEVDMDNEYTKVIPSTKGMIPTAGSYGVQTMDHQAAYAEENGYGNVMAAMNISLSWYDSTYYDEHPELIGEPLGYLILDGVQYTNSRGKTSGAQTCLVINYDEKDGVARPADIPKTQIRSTADDITGWEEQVIPANFGFLVKDGKMVYTSEEHTSEGASRSMLGIKADGTIVMVMNDGRQAPYSTGFNNYEMSEAMLKLGCVYAINGDGGGSSQFLSQRPGEELKVNCSPSDGALRATTHGVLAISTAPSTGEFVRAHVEAENEYFTPGSSVQFNAIGADLAGGAAEIPEDAYWQISNNEMGAIDENGLFVSNGQTGEVTAQLVYNGDVKGSATINIVVPDAIAFGGAAAYTVPFNNTITLDVTATYGVFDVALKPDDYTISIENSSLGTLNGNKYTSGEAAGTTNITVTLNGYTSVCTTVPLTVGKGSDVIFSFEDGTEGANLNNWEIKSHEGKYTPYTDISVVTSETGMVHNGKNALAIHMPTHTRVHGHEGYDGNSITWIGDPILLENATSIGLWVYIPEEATQTEIALNYVWYNASGVQQRTTPDLCLNDDFNDIETSGWYYLSVPISKSEAYIENATAVAASQGYKRNFFLKFYVTNSGNAGDESSYMGDITYYIDDVTVDYSDAVDDRIAPVFSGTYANNISTDTETALTAGQTTTLNSSTLSFIANVSDNNAIDSSSVGVTVDGKKISATYRNGKITSSDVTLGAGIHRIVYDIADTMGNVSKAVRYIKVAGTDVAVNVVPHNPDQTVALTSSVYWLDVIASNAEKVDKITLKLDLDTMHAWELSNTELAYNYDIDYYYASVADEKDNVMTIVLTNNSSDATGNAVIASIPIRVWSYCGNDTGTELTLAQAWTTGHVPAVSVNVEVEAGEVVYSDNDADTFSAEKIHIDTEAYIHQYKMDKTYYANNAYHVHTEEAIDNVEATCTTGGYTNRTYCSVCDSVVDWGITENATGHTWAINEEGKLACINGGELFNGIYTDGKEYVDGVVVTDGWVDGKYYYVNGAKVTGHYVIDGVMHTFDENGVYNPSYAYTDFYTTADGKLMYFVGNKPLTGYQYLASKPYFFDANGYGFEGEYILCGETCVFDDGHFVSCSTANVLNAGMVGPKAEYVIYADGTFKLDGSGETYSFTNHGTRPFTGYNYQIKTLEIGADITRIGGYLFSYSSINNVKFEENSKLQQIGTAAFYEDTWGFESIELPESVTYISDMAFGKCTSLSKVIIPASVTSINKNTFKNSPNVTLYVTDGSYALEFAKNHNLKYQIVESSTPDTPAIPEAPGQIVDENGTLYYYLNGSRNYAGLIYKAGAFYYVRSSGQLATNTTYWVTKTNDLLDVGDYTFGADGKMINPPVVVPPTEEPTPAPTPGVPDTPAIPEAPGQIVDENGTLYYYLNGSRNYAGLIYKAGAFYYVRSSGQLATNTTYWVTKTNDLLDAGDYTFGADGKMINPPVIVPPTEEPTPTPTPGVPDTPAIPEAPGQIVDENGTLYYYLNGSRNYAGLIYKDGAFYYVRSSGQLATNTTYWVTKTNDLLDAGNYTFDADGKMINPPIVVPPTEEPDAPTIPEAEGEIVDENGTLYYYLNGSRNYGGLIYKNGNYYYVRSSGKLAVNTTYWVTKTNDLLEAGNYTFDADGKMITE